MLNKDFKELLALLHSNRVDFLVVGAHALAAHGKPRYTGDLDVWVRQTPDNLARLIAALTQFGFAALGLSEDDFLQPEAKVQLGHPPARIDLLTAIDGVTFEAAYEHKLIVELAGMLLPVISIDHLINNKLAAGRPKDLLDVAELQRLLKPSPHPHLG
jgi:hypothetical protein